MELAPFAALETCVGRLPPLPLQPHSPVRGSGGATRRSQHNNCTGFLSNREDSNVPFKMPSGDSTACEVDETSDWPEAPKEEQRRASDHVSVSQEGYVQQREEQQQWHQVDPQHLLTCSSIQRDRKFQESQNESCEDVVFGVDIPEAGAHLTCLVRNRTLEVCDSSPHPRFAPDTHASSRVPSAAVAREVVPPTAAAEPATPAPAASIRLEAALAQAAAAVPMMPCLVRLHLRAPLLSHELFDVLVTPASPPGPATGARSRRRAGGARSRGTNAESSKDSTSDSSCCSDGYRSSNSGQGCRYTGTLCSGDSNGTRRGHSRYSTGDCGASSDTRGTKYRTIREGTSVGTDYHDAGLHFVRTDLAASLASRNTDVYDGMKILSMPSDARIFSGSHGTTVAACTATKEKSAFVDKAGSTHATAAVGNYADVREKTLDFPSCSRSATPTERQKNFDTRLAASLECSKGYGKHGWPTLTICFVLANGEVHRVQFKLLEALSRDQQPGSTENIAEAGSGCAESSALPEGKSRAAVVRPGQHLLLRLRSHIFVMLTRGLLSLSGEIVAMQCCEEHGPCTRKTGHTATFSPFDCFLPPPAGSRPRPRLLALSQHDDEKQPSWFCEEHEWEKWRGHNEGQTEQDEQVYRGVDKHFCEAGAQSLHLAEARKSTDLVVDARAIPEATAPAPSVGPSVIDGVTCPAGPPLRLLLLSTRAVLLEMSEPHVYGVLRFRKSCASSSHRSDRKSGITRSKRSGCVKQRNRAAFTATLNAEADIEKAAQGSTKTERRRSAAARTFDSTAEEAATCSVVAGQLGRPFCKRRKRKFSSSTAGGLCIWRRLTSCWSPWKRQRAGFCCVAYGGDNEVVSTTLSGGESRSNSDEPATQDQQIPNGDSRSRGTSNPSFCHHVVNHSQDAPHVFYTVPTDMPGAEIAAQSNTLHCLSGPHGAKQSSAATFIKKLVPTRVLPYLVSSVFGFHKSREQLGAQTRHEELPEMLPELQMQRLPELGYVQGDRASGRPGSREASERGATAAAAAAAFIEQHGRKLSFEEVNRRRHFQYLWATSQHVARLPRAAAGGGGAGGYMQRGDCLLVTCSVVSVPDPDNTKHLQPSPQMLRGRGENRVDAQCTHRSRERIDAYVPQHEGGAEGGRVERRRSVFSEYGEGESPRERKRPGSMVVVAVWKTRAVGSSRLSARAANGVARRSAASRATPENQCDASIRPTAGEPVRVHRCIKADSIPRGPSLQLLCEYTYMLDNSVAGTQEVHLEAVTPSTLTAKAAPVRSTTVEMLRSLQPMQQGDGGDPPFTVQEGEGDAPLSAGLVNSDTYQQSESDTDPSGSTSASCFAKAVTQANAVIFAESVHVAAATAALPAAQVPATARCEHGWWIGVELRFSSHSYIDVRKRSITSGDRATGGYSESPSSSSGASFAVGRNSCGGRAVDASLQFLLLRCHASESWRDSWRLEKAGQFSFTQEGLLRCPAATESGRAQERHQRSRDTFHKSRTNEGLAEGHLDGKPSLYPNVVAGDTVTYGKGFHTCRENKQEEPRRDGRPQCEDARKPHNRRQQQRHGQAQTKLLLTSTHLWLLSREARTRQDACGGTTQKGDGGLQYMREHVLAASSRCRPLCCCPRRALWAIPLPQFNPPSHDATGASASSFLHPFTPSGATTAFSGKQRITADTDAASEKRSVWPAGVEPFRVLHVDDLSCLQECTNACCSAVFRNRIREVAETARVVTVLSRLRAAVRSVLRRCLAALASSAAEPVGFPAVAAAAVWNYQPLVTDAFSRVFPDGRCRSTEAAAELLDWFAIELTAGVNGCSINGQSSATVATEQAASHVSAETAVRATAAVASADGGGKPYAPGNIPHTVTAARHSADVGPTYEDTQAKEADPSGDLLIALLSEYSVLLRGRDTEAERCMARMEALSAHGCPQGKMSVSGGVREGMRDRRIAVLLSRVRLLLELLTDALWRSSLTSQREQSRQDSEHTDERGDEESLRYRQAERAQRWPQQQRKEQQNQLQWGERNAFNDRLIVASVVSLVLCWHLRRLMRRCHGAGGGATLPSCAILGESYAWGAVLQVASARANAAFNAGHRGMVYAKEQAFLSLDPSRSSSFSRHRDIYSLQNCSVEEALLQSPLKCVLGGISRASASGVTRVMSASGSGKASTCGHKLPSVEAATPDCAWCLAASDQRVFAVPLLICRHRASPEGLVRDPATSSAAGLMPSCYLMERSSYSLSVIRPALTTAEEIDWQIQHSLKAVVFGAAELTTAAAATGKDEETKKERGKGSVAGDVCVEGTKALFDRENEEAAEADADCLALGSLMSCLIPAASVWQTPEYDALRASGTGEAALAEDTVTSTVRQVPRAGTCSSQGYTTWPCLHPSSTQYAGSTPAFHHRDAFGHIQGRGQRVPCPATGVCPTATEYAAKSIPFTTSLASWIPNIEVGWSFLTEFLCGKGLYARSVEQDPCCYCRDTKFTQGQYCMRLFRESPSESCATLRAAAALQQKRQLVVERLQHVLRLSSSVSWRLAAVGSFLRLGADAVLQAQQHDDERQPQSQKQEEPGGDGKRWGKICAHLLATGGVDGTQSTGTFVAKDATSFKGDTGMPTGQSTADTRSYRERDTCATSSSSVWRHVQAVLYERSSSVAGVSRGTDVYSSYLLSCAAAAVSPLAAAHVHPGQNLCDARVAAAAAQLPGALSAIVGAPRMQAAPLATTDRVFSKLLRTIRWSTLLPLSVNSHLVGDWVAGNTSLAGIESAGDPDMSWCRYKIAETRCTAAELQSPLQLDALRGRLVLLLLRTEPSSFLSLDTLSDADVAAVSPACPAQANAPLPVQTEEESTRAQDAAAAAVAARVGFECLSSSPWSSARCDASCATERDWQQEHEETASALWGVWPSTHRSDIQLRNPSSHAGFPQDRRRKKLRWTPEAGAATASRQNVDSFLSFIASPVQHVLASAVVAGIVAQHELLCNIAAGACYFGQLLLQRQKQNEQYEEPGEAQEHTKAGKAQQDMHLERKEQQVLDDDLRGCPSETDCVNEDGLLAARVVASGPASALRACSTPTERVCSASARRYSSSVHRDDTSRECFAPESLTSLFPVGDDGFPSSRAGSGAVNTLVSSVFEALDAALLLAAGLRCLFETRKVAFHEGQPQRLLHSGLRLQQDRQPDVQCSPVAWKLGDVSGPMRVVGCAAAAGQCGKRLSAAGKATADSAAGTCSQSVKAAVDVKEESRTHEGYMLLLFLMFCEYSMGRNTSVTNTSYGYRIRSNGVKKKSRGRGARSNGNYSAGGGMQAMKSLSRSDTETYARPVELLHEWSCTPSAASDGSSEGYDSAPERHATPAPAGLKALRAHTRAAAGCARRTTQAADSRCHNVQGMVLLLPWLIRNLCACRLSKAVLMPQRIRAARQLADFLCRSPSMLHRLAAHSLRCWTYQQHCVPCANTTDAAGVFSEIKAATALTARLLSRLHYRALELSHVVAAQQDTPLQQHQQRLPLPRGSEQAKHEWTTLKRQNSLFCVEPDEDEDEGEESQQQAGHRGQEGWLQQESKQQSEQWHQQQQEWRQLQQQLNWQCQQQGTLNAAGAPGQQGAADRQQQRTCTIYQGRAAAEQEADSKNYVSDASSEGRVTEAYYWGYYAQLLHHVACRLQQLHPKVAALTLEFDPDQHNSMSSASQNEADDMTQYTMYEGDGLSASASDNIGRKCGACEKATAAFTVVKKTVQEAPAGTKSTSTARLSVAVALLQAAAQAAATSSTRRRELLPLLTNTADRRHPRAHIFPWCSGAADAVVTPCGIQGVYTFALRHGHTVTGPDTETPKGHLGALLQVCYGMLPSALPDAAELWKAALTTALQDGNIAAAIAVLPRLRSCEDREEQLLHILASLLIQHSPDLDEWGRKPAYVDNAAGTPEETQTSVSTHGKNVTACCYSGRTSGCYRSGGYNSEADLFRFRHRVHNLQNAERVSLAALRAACGASQQHLSVEGILLRLCVSADCGCEGPALAAFQLLKKDFLSSGRRCDAALLAYLHAAAVQTQLYAASAAYYRAAATSSPDTAETEASGTRAAAEAAASRRYADIVATDECFPSWLLQGFKQLQGVARHPQQGSGATVFRGNGSHSQFKWRSPCTVVCSGVVPQPNSSTSDSEKQTLECTPQGRDRGEHARGEDYKHHLRLAEAADRVRRLYLTFVRGGRWVNRTQPTSAVPIAAARAASCLDDAAGLVKSVGCGQAAAATADDAVAERSARILHLRFRKSLSLLESSASLCANLLLDTHLYEPSPFSWFPFSTLLQTSGNPGSATPSAGIILLPSLLRPLLLPNSNSHGPPATSGVFSGKQRTQPQSRGQRKHQQQQLRLERCTCPASIEEMAPEKVLTALRPPLTARRDLERGHHFVLKKPAATPSLRPCPAQTSSAPVPATTEVPAMLSSSIRPRSRCSLASAIVAEVVHMEVLKCSKLPENPPYITALLARCIAALAGAKLRLLQTTPAGTAAVQQVLPWSFRTADTVASLGFAGQLCAAIQLADITQVDVFIACAAFVAHALTQQATGDSDVQASGCWRLLMQQLWLRRANAASGAGSGAPALDEDLALNSSRKIKLDADVRALHSRLLQLLTVVQYQLEQQGLPPPPAVVFECLRQGELPADPLAALGRLLHQGRLLEAFALVLREGEQGESEQRRQQLGTLRRGTEGKGFLTCGTLFRKETKRTGGSRRPLGTSAYAFLNVAWPLLIQLEAALAVKAAEQRNQVVTSTAPAEGGAGVETMLATLQDIFARYEKASRVACSRDAQLVSLALKPTAHELICDSDLTASTDVVDTSRPPRRNMATAQTSKDSALSCPREPNAARLL